NRGAANAGVLQSAASNDYRLVVEGKVRWRLSFDASQLETMAAHEATLPISCVEGWSYSARWRGVRVRDLLVMAGAAPTATARVHSLEQGSVYSSSFLDHAQAHDRDTRPANLAQFFVGGALAHDLLFAPVVLVVGVLLARAAPRPARAWLQAGLLVSGCLVLFSYPLVRDYAKVLHNPSSLPHNYAANLAVTIGV